MTANAHRSPHCPILEPNPPGLSTSFGSVHETRNTRSSRSRFHMHVEGLLILPAYSTGCISKISPIRILGRQNPSTSSISSRFIYRTFSFKKIIEFFVILKNDISRSSIDELPFISARNSAIALKISWIIFRSFKRPVGKNAIGSILQLE